MEAAETTNNGTKGTPKGLTTSQKDNQKEKPRRQLPSLPSAVAVADMNSVDYSALADKTAVEWNFLQNYEMFSLSPDGSFPMMKVSRSKAVRIADRQVMMVGGGRCYRVSLSNHPKPKQTLAAN